MLPGLNTLRLARLRLCSALTSKQSIIQPAGGRTVVKLPQSSSFRPQFAPPAWGDPLGHSRHTRHNDQPISFCPRAENGSLQTHPSPLSPGLYLVGTPIGNLEDLSVRALKVLQNATVILAEDTRHSRKLLNHYDIRAQMYSFHQHNEHSKQDKVLEQLAQGASVAVISDAGMPLISDPGAGLVAAAAAAGHEVIPIAGPSAFLLALVASGLSSSRFTFVGFLPDKAKSRQLELQKMADMEHTLIFYVPPHDLLPVLKDAIQVLGGGRQCVVARELTKVHEEVVRCTLLSAVQKFSQISAKGEITLLIDGAVPADDTITPDELRQQVASLIASGQSTSSAAKIASKQLGMSRKQAYAAALELQASSVTDVG